MRVWILELFVLAILCCMAGAANAQAPGTPPPGCPAFTIDLLEGPTEDFAGEHLPPQPVPCGTVASGYVVLFDSSTLAPQDPRNWSDVLVFSNPGQIPAPGQPASYMSYVSDTPNSAGQETGMTDADFANLGIHVIDIQQNPTTVYQMESSTSDVNPYAPIATAPYVYRIHSDPPEIPTPTKSDTWGRLKMLYR